MPGVRPDFYYFQNDTVKQNRFQGLTAQAGRMRRIDRPGIAFSL